MSNDEWSHPEYFEELCALAASGQISEPEFVELRDHMQQCAHCRSISADFIDIFHNRLPLMNPELVASSKVAGLFSANSSYRERFLARARKEGLSVSHQSWRDGLRTRLGIGWAAVPSYPQVAAVAMVLLVASVGILGYSLRESNARYRALAADMAVMSNQISHQAQLSPAQEGRPEKLPSLETIPSPPAVVPSETSDELMKARQDYAAAEARTKELDERLQAAAVELQASRVELEKANSSQTQLAKKLAETEQAAAGLNGELQTVRESRSKDATTIAVQGLQIQKLSEQVSAQAESLERERSLLAAGRDIRELMGARNLHIADVLDVDSKGKESRALGRVFYTEGKSLIFYAYDLGDQGTLKRNASFQVWGSRGAAQTATQSLGVFYIDDQKQNRWVLKFDDPKVLSEIDSVFVTVEPSGGSAKPTGHKLLYAYLKTSPNHP